MNNANARVEAKVDALIEFVVGPEMSEELEAVEEPAETEPEEEAVTEEAAESEDAADESGQE